MINVLIIKEEFELARLWERALVRLGAKVQVARSAQMAIDSVQKQYFESIVLDLDLSQDAAVGIADFVSYRWPDTRVLFVTNGSFFSDGSIFQLCANACGYVHGAIEPDDLAAMAHHYAGQANALSLPCGS